jgi:hypothetical protein
MCIVNETSFSIITKSPEYEYGFVIDLGGNLIPLIPPKLVIEYTTDLEIDYTTDLEIEYEEINLLN